MNPLDQIKTHQKNLKACRSCPEMIGPVVTGEAVSSPVMLIGQAPGDKEGPAGRPFAWTAGKTLFKWFDSIGLGEEQFRSRVYMAAVCRCFPGKKPRGGDRVPTTEEIENCARWMHAEFEILKPGLIIPVGKLAILQFMEAKKLNGIIGHNHQVEIAGCMTDMIPLPHPSGASTWHRTEPGKTLLQDALALIGEHPAWRSLL
ncbi:MAG: uracil-DNA glycosylase family protein [Candidatus Sedimenticola sp. 20ELBAFRAG]